MCCVSVHELVYHVVSVSVSMRMCGVSVSEIVCNVPCGVSVREILHSGKSVSEQWVSFKEGSGIQVAYLQPVQRRRLILFISLNHIQFSSNGQDTSVISAVFSKIL